MVSISRVGPGKYMVSDGRSIRKDGSGWCIYRSDGGRQFGPVTSLKSAKEYVVVGRINSENYNRGSSYGRRKARRSHNAYMASEAKNGNYVPIIVVISAMAAFAFIMEYLRG